MGKIAKGTILSVASISRSSTASRRAVRRFSSSAPTFFKKFFPSTDCFSGAAFGKQAVGVDAVTMPNFNEFQRAVARRSNFDARRTPTTPSRTRRATTSALFRRVFFVSVFHFVVFVFFFASGVLFLAASGCASTDSNKKSSCFLFPKKESDVESLPSRKEREIVNRASTSTDGAMKGTWEPTETDLAAARNAGIDVKKFVWAAQRPNGAVLFPRELPGPGPLVVLEPKTIAAPIGSEVVLVASYVGADSTYLRVGEKVEWSLTGVGSFLATNPANGSCLDRRTKKKVDDRYLTTETTNKLWRIHRGTETPLDDVTILRGQTWTSVAANEEGTSSVVVFANDVDAWDRRKATAEIYWLDAAFIFPQTNAAPLRTTQSLTTVVCRRSNAQPRPGWPVRYEILSGNAGLGPNMASVLEVPTDANGTATVSLTEKNGQGGTCKVAATVLRPASATDKSVVVERQTFYRTWTDGLVHVDLVAPTAATSDGDLPYRLVVTNNSDFLQNVVVELDVPSSAKLVRAEPLTTSADGSRVAWEIRRIEPRNSFAIDLTLRKIGEGAIFPSYRLRSTAPADPDAYQNAPSDAAQPPAAPNGAIPPVVSPTPNSPSAAPAPDPNGTQPPVESPTPTDPASTPPSLGRFAPQSPNEIANAAARTFETTALRFPDGPLEKPNDAKSAPTVAVPFDARFALTNPTKSAEKVVVKIVANPGLELLVDGRPRSDVVYPARPLDEIADVVFKARVVADAPGAQTLLFYVYRENGELLASDVLALNVADAAPIAVAKTLLSR